MKNKTLFILILHTTILVTIILGANHQVTPDAESVSAYLTFLEKKQIAILLFYSILFYLIVFTIFIDFALILRLNNKTLFHNLNLATSFLTLMFIAHHLLNILTVDQFSLLSTFIGLPFVTIIPKFIGNLTNSIIQYLQFPRQRIDDKSKSVTHYKQEKDK